MNPVARATRKKEAPRVAPGRKGLASIGGGPKKERTLAGLAQGVGDLGFGVGGADESRSERHFPRHAAAS